MEESEILFDTEPFRARAGETGLPAVVERLAVAMAVALDWPDPLQAELHPAALVRDAGKLLLLSEEAGAAVPAARLALHPRALPARRRRAAPAGAALARLTAA